MSADIHIHGGKVEVTGNLSGLEELVRFTQEMLCLTKLTANDMVPELLQPSNERIKWALTMAELPPIPA